MLVTDHSTHSSTCDNFGTFLRLAEHLHRGAEWRLLWTPNAGAERDKKRSLYVPASGTFRPPVARLQGANLYFGVHGLARRRPHYLSSHNEDVSAVNCLFAEFDGVDEVQEEEWQPFYVLPALDGLTDGQARGALQKAQTQAREAAYAAQPAEYKARALARVQGLEQRPSAVWASGGGYQCVWLLRETVHVTDANRAHVAGVQRSWVHFVGADPGAHDLRRVLRVPGSHNVKKRYAPHYPEVTFLWADFERLYTFDELAALLPAEEPAPAHGHRQRTLYTPAGYERLQMPAHVPLVPACPEVDAYNAQTPIAELLASLAYTQGSTGRMSRPGATTQGIELHAEDNSCTNFSSGDILPTGRRLRPADVLLVYEHAGDVDRLLEALGATDTASMPTMLRALRLWLHSVDFAPRVPEELRTRGYRTKGRDKCCLSAVLDIMAGQERQSLCAPVSVGQLEEAANVGRASAHRALETLCTFALEPVDGAGWPGQARRYRVRPAIVAEALRLYRAESCSNGTGSTGHALHEIPVPFEQLCAGELALDTHKAHDAFCYVSTPLTDEAWQARRQEAREADEPEPVLTVQMRRRRAASLASLGRNALLVVDALEALDGQADKKTVREACHMSAPTLARTLGRLEEAGLVRLGHYSVELVELRADWSAHLDEVTPLMPTHGTGERRAYRLASQRAAYYEEALEHAPPERHAYMRRRQAEAEARRDAYEELHGLQERRRKERARRQLDELHVQARYALVQEAHAAQPALEVEVSRLRRERVRKRDAWRMLYQAGYSQRAIREAMQRYWPPPVAQALSEEQRLHLAFDSFGLTPAHVRQLAQAAD